MAELIGTFSLVFGGALGAIVESKTTSTGVGTGFATSFSVATVIYTF